jgi:hypothetical protein
MDLHAHTLKQVPKGIQDHGSIVCFTPPPGEVLPFHSLHVGKSVTIVPTSKTPLNSGKRVASGAVFKASATEIQVKTNNNIAPFNNSEKRWRLDLGVSKAGYVRTMEALQATNKGSMNFQVRYVWPEILRRWKFGKLQSPRDMDHPSQTIPACSASTESQKSTPGIFSSNPDIVDWAQRHSQNPHPKEGDPNLNLNETQVKAIALMLLEWISLIQGVSKLNDVEMNSITKLIF